ncbi:SU(VAR)3-9 homolog 5 [Striga asiatica]|uniref:SU(VAR)3-9 homolog 5 n=1 Tax=Striga asiatica TaxID=4170 RepID=A0A5A7PPP2_STRAF|nr:SU(VAR)3-9 homolog 5 [Striga asiatica]
MVAQTEQDPFASIAELCRPTSSQDAKFPNCPFARESDDFPGMDSDDLSSSPEPTPPEPSGIVMVSPLHSAGSTPPHTEHNTVSHTPPAHHLPSYQKPDGSSSGSARLVCRLDKSIKARSSRGGLELDEGIEPDEIRVPAEPLFGETVPADETVAINDEIVANGVITN